MASRGPMVILSSAGERLQASVADPRPDRGRRAGRLGTGPVVGEVLVTLRWWLLA